MKTLVVGAGEMGQWFGDVLTETTQDATLTFLDTDGTVARSAAQAIAGATGVEHTNATFELVCIAVPIPAASDAVETYSRQASDAIVDVTGTMREPVAAMETHAPDLERVSLHPLFAPQNEPGNVAVVNANPGAHTNAILSTLEERGNTVFETTPAEHDDAMKTVQARAHTAVLAYGLAAESIPEGFQTPISESLAALVDQVTAGESHVYADIQASFGGAADVADAASALASADREQFEGLFDEARLTSDEE